MFRESEVKHQGCQEQKPVLLLCHVLSTVWTAEGFYYPNTLAIVKLNIFTAVTGERTFITDR